MNQRKGRQSATALSAFVCKVGRRAAPGRVCLLPRTSRWQVGRLAARHLLASSESHSLITALMYSRVAGRYRRRRSSAANGSVKTRPLDLACVSPPKETSSFTGSLAAVVLLSHKRRQVLPVQRGVRRCAAGAGAGAGWSWSRLELEPAGAEAGATLQPL